MAWTHSVALSALTIQLLSITPAVAEDEQQSALTERTVESQSFTRDRGDLSDVELSPAIEWDRRSDIGERLSEHGSDLLGDTIDTHMGSLSFSHTDISLPGNSDLPVTLIRELTQGYFHNFDEDVEFGDWNYSVPRLHVITSTQSGTYTTDWAGARCTDPSSAFAVSIYSGANASDVQSYVYPVEYSNGLQLAIPGQGTQQVLSMSPNVSQPFPSAAQFVTPAGWYFICGSANDGGEGFVGIAPNGDQYRFDRYAQFKHRNFGAITPTGGNAGPSRIIERVRAMLLATEVTDVHGNWVRYDYDASGRLTRIYANDGRSITLSYNADGVVSSATANGRTWTYGYVSAEVGDMMRGDYAAAKQILNSVTRPDGTSWSFDLVAMHHRPQTGTYCTNIGGSLSLTHPNGVTGTFTVSELKHRRGWAEWMTETTIRCSGAFINPRQSTYYDIYHSPTETMSVTQKTVSGPDMPTSQWTYTYEQDVEEERYPVGHEYEGHPIATSENDPTNWTKVVNPDGSETTYVHYWSELSQVSVDYKHVGKLVRKEVRSSPGGSLLEVVDYSYLTAGSFGPSYLPNDYQYAPLRSLVSSASSTANVQPAKQVQSRDGDTFTTEYVYNTTQSSGAYSYGKPIQTKVWSNVSTTPRTTDITYEHNTTRWVLGLTKTVTVNSRLTDSYNYTSKGDIYQHWKYGQKIAEYSYNSSGTLNAITDARGQVTTLQNWKRGMPQQLTRPDNTVIYQYVDNNGWLTSTRDGRGNTTSYSRDAMGRLTAIDYPGSWLNTTISYDFSQGGAKQTILRGNALTEIDYDGMFRPVLEKRQALDTGWVAYVKTNYNNTGHVAFKSLPATSASPAAGTNYTYDSLGRVLTETETVAPYAQVSHQYMSSHRHRVYDPSNAYTDYYAYGYDGPGSDDYRAIYHSSGTKTDLVKNVWGELTQLRQWGTQNGYYADQSQYYYYDAKRRVCRHYTPETGATLYAYNAAGQVTAYAQGQANSGCTVPGSTARVDLSYDAMGRLTVTDYDDGITPNISRSYDADGNLLSVSRGGVNWDYSYNNLSQPTAETLTLDSRTYALSYSYNSAGQLTQKTLPSGRSITYSNDGLGRPLTVRNNGALLASSMSYHANGSLAQAAYANGHQFTQALNARGLPQQLYVSDGAQVALDQSMTYDARGNLTQLTDAAVPSNSRANSYDGLSRLVSASGPWGSGSYTYDALGNLRQKQLGSRTVGLSYNSVNRLVTSDDSGASGLRSFSYDSRGNVTAAGALQFNYDAENQPVSVSGSSSGTYVYDGNLKRVKQSVNGATIYNVYDQAGQLVHVDALDAGKSTDYIHGAQGTLARITNNVVTFLHHDSLGSAQSGTDSNGSVIWQESYTPYGEAINDIAANKNLAGFTGHITDDATDLSYMQARYYDPVIGRFYSNDPVGAIRHLSTPNGIHGFNRYAYGNNNPYRYKDPTGKSSEEANMWANMFGFSSADQATTRINNSIESGRQAVVNSTSPENLSAVSDTLAGATVVALVAGQPEVAAVTGMGSFVAGLAAAVQGDDPVAGVVTETALQVTGTKSVGTAAKIVNEALDSTPAVRNGIDAASDATQTIIKNELKEEINNE
ncbi:RHS repeat domain-containing protein [Pseudidiomarina insulisalsae]|uniref:Teneurin-like YD-shell domain-containing protein n=1 Tax=Pseudidiomarina insulisalsae TaxID=575789 RepID=A0A432YA73_9GAMM|nr:RHS repeat-associated core domain-containing protein [Pseudidiomarina insulisalsae]RUO57833.1 hypothetical protein CWI71_11660 [Pseudidiomarina insulisalsae]